jgi:hypothetical protein
MSDTPLLMTADQASERLGGIVSARWLRDRAAAAAIPHTQLGRKRCWSEDDLTALIKGGYVDPETRGRKVQRRTSAVRRAVR